MALKDWKKTKDKLDEVVWENKRNDFKVKIVKFWSWEFMVYNENGMQIKFQHSIQSKSQALGYAKQYMRTH